MHPKGSVRYKNLQLHISIHLHFTFGDYYFILDIYNNLLEQTAIFRLNCLKIVFLYKNLCQKKTLCQL